MRNIAEVSTAIARGDLSARSPWTIKAKILELKETINTMVDQLNGFAAEVTRLARRSGHRRQPGQPGAGADVAGTWKDLTDNVNVMANNLTNQVRGIVKVVTAVANGDLRQRLTVESKGEVNALADTINSMTNTLAIFADQVTSVAREVGVEGRLGGQAHVPGAAGTWKDLTANVNLLAANLTNQVRAIAEVATAVTKGDLTRSIQVEARGEVSELKDNINAMIGNLRATTERNNEQDWLKTNLAKFSRMMQGQRDPRDGGRKLLLSELAPLVNAQQGIVYVMDGPSEDAHLRELATYADQAQADAGPRRYALGEGLVGQAAMSRQHLLITDVPDDSVRVASGLMNVRPRNVIVLPVLYEGHVKAVMELASTGGVPASHLAFLESVRTGSMVGVVLNTIETTMRIEGLLTQLPAAWPVNCWPSRPNCSRPMRNSPTRPSCSPSRMRKWSARTRKSNWRAGRWRRRPRNWRSPRGTSRNSWPTCHTVAAHAAQQHPDPGSAAVGKRRWQSHRSSGGVRDHHSRRRHGPAQSDQRHPGSVQDQNPVR